jgi:hypothetical protein
MRSSVSEMPMNSSTSNSEDYKPKQPPPVNLANLTHPTVFRQKRLPTEPILDNIPGHQVYLEGLGPSPIASPRSPPNIFDASEGSIGSTLQVPKSPRTPRSMGHLIKHRFTKTFKPGKCDLCSEYMFNGKPIIMKSAWTSMNFVSIFSQA